MSRFSKVLLATAAACTLAACGKDDDPERQFKVVQFKLTNACVFYTGKANAKFCECAFNELVKEFGREDVIRLGDVGEESELKDEKDIATHRAMREFFGASTQGVCKDLIVKDADPEKKTFFQKLIPQRSDN
jgi:hypothetical protein